MIHAKHSQSGRTGMFSERAWELLPAHKDGWQIELSPPPEVLEHIAKQSPAEPPTEVKPHKRRKHENKT